MNPRESQSTGVPGKGVPGRRPRRRRRPVLRFVVVLVGLMLAFNALFYAWFSKTEAFDSYLALNAKVSASVLCLFGEEATASGMALTSPLFSLSIKRGCDAIQASVFLALLIAASPLAVPPARRLGWMIGGTALLLLINLVRIVSLYYCGVWFSPKVFEVMHVEVWQMAFILMPILLWLFWIRRVSRTQVTQSDATA